MDSSIKFALKLKQNTISDYELINDLKRVAKENGLINVSHSTYEQFGKYSPTTLERRFGTWNKCQILAGLNVNEDNTKITNEELFENIYTVWTGKGKQPVRRDMDSAKSLYSSGAYLRRFKTWNNALVAFVEYINDDQADKDYSDIPRQNARNNHKTKRDPNLRMRFNVMRRDNFKCVACGASPSTDSNVELHIDHIYPWSKGGETVFENLQTLCSECNLGKGNQK